MSSSAQWADFEEEWRKAIGAWGLSSFHMADFESYYGEFSAWTAEQHRDRLNHLLDLISDHTFGGIGLSLSIADYENVVPEELRGRLTPYHVLAFNCFRRVNDLTNSMSEMFVEAAQGLTNSPRRVEGVRSSLHL